MTRESSVAAPKLVYGIVALGFLGGCIHQQAVIKPKVPPPTVSATARRTIDRIAPAVVSIYGKPGRSAGTGVIVHRRGFVLTASHVLRAIPFDRRIRLANGDSFRFSILVDNPPHDFALLKIDNEGPFPALPLGERVSRGQKMMLLGRTRDLELHATTGVVQMAAVNIPPALVRARHLGREDNAFEAAIIHSAPAVPGDSGGAIVDETGRLVGMNVIGNKSSTLTVAIPTGPLRPALEQIFPTRVYGERRRVLDQLRRPRSFADFEDELAWTFDGLRRHGVDVLGDAPAVEAMLDGIGADLFERKEGLAMNPTASLRWVWKEFHTRLGAKSGPAAKKP